MISSQELLHCLQRAQAGVDWQAEHFVRTAERIQRPFLSRWMQGILVRQDLLEDVLQDAQLQVWLHFRSCRADSDARVVAWLQAVARTTAIDALRRWRPEHGARIVVLTGQTEWDVVCAEAPDAPPFDLAPLFRRLEQDFGPDALRLLWLRLVQGDTWGEIGADLGITWTAARRRYQRVIGASRRYMLTYVRVAVPGDSPGRRWLDRTVAALRATAPSNTRFRS